MKEVRMILTREHSAALGATPIEKAPDRDHVRAPRPSNRHIVVTKIAFVLLVFAAELALSVPSTASAPHLNLRLDSLSVAGDLPAAPIWAFITVTNNETQHITTITPQPSR